MGEDRSQEGRKHIFAINGSPEFLNIVRELFQEENYNVTTTNYVPNSFDQIQALQPDALIVDIVIGQSAGWELLEQLHAEAATTGIPVLVLSTSPHLLQQAQEQSERPLPGQAARRRRAAHAHPGHDRGGLRDPNQTAWTLRARRYVLVRRSP